MGGARIASVVVAVALACGVASTESYRATGVVRSVDPAARQIRIAHDEIAGFMPAMTMSFDVASAELLAGVEPGARVAFSLERSASTLRITALEVTEGEAAAAVSGVSAQQPPPPELAPGFRLTDQDGRELALADLRGNAVLLDFVFTRCPGPCPILTTSHVALQRMLPPAVAARTRLVSVSLDPSWDTPERLREYGAARGARFENWSFLTGDPDVVQELLSAYGVGTVRQPDGTLDHVVATFLIDPDGRIVERYLGLEHDPRAILADLEALL
jgi:protein SCO1/2